MCACWLTALLTRKAMLACVVWWLSHLLLDKVGSPVEMCYFGEDSSFICLADCKLVITLRLSSCQKYIFRADHIKRWSAVSPRELISWKHWSTVYLVMIFEIFNPFTSEKLHYEIPMFHSQEKHDPNNQTINLIMTGLYLLFLSLLRYK